MRRRRYWWIAAGLAVCLLATVLFIKFYVFNEPFGRPGLSIRVNIPEGYKADQIGQSLAANHVIGSSFWFHLYLFATRQEASLHAGDYVFASGMTLPQVVAEMVQGPARSSTVVVTIPEGFTVRQIAALLAYDHICPDKAFMWAAEHGSFPGYAFLKTIPVTHKIRDHLEGYLFPDTYYFLRGESPQLIIETMLNEMRLILSPSVRSLIKKEHLTIPEVMTIASMVEREAKLSSERPLIASVIFNRLHRVPPMKLQIDATVGYGLGGITNLTQADLVTHNPYNTYVYPGLPPGPIANPGLASIMATLHPAHTDYYYYVARYDGTGGSYFAKTYAQQLKNIARSDRNLARRSR